MLPPTYNSSQPREPRRQWYANYGAEDGVQVDFVEKRSGSSSVYSSNYGAEDGVQLDFVEKRSGSSSVYSSNRSSAWNGPQQDMMGKMEPNRTYAISAWAKLAGSIAPSDNILWTIRIGDDGVYKWRNFGDAVDSVGWTKVAGELTVDVVGTLTSLELFAEGPSAGEAFWVDDVVVVPLGAPAPTFSPAPLPTPAPVTPEVRTVPAAIQRNRSARQEVSD